MKSPAVMTFEEIAEREGITRQAAFAVCRRALLKLQRRHRQQEFVHLVVLYRARIECQERLTAG
jgi:hypothetical protein